VIASEAPFSAGKVIPSWAESRGIVTLADYNYFPGLMLLHRSVQETWPLPIACFDAGITKQQKALAAEKCIGLQILPLPDVDLLATIRQVFEAATPLAKHNKRVWPLWICPLLVAAAPFRRVFWLDCDIAVLRNLDQLFQLIDDGPVFTPENNAPAATPNQPDLYKLLPIARSFDPLEPRVNGGVSGWDLVRDKEILDAYIYAIERACQDERIRKAISWHDQGALIWAIQKWGLESRVLDSNRWNLCVRHTSLAARPIPWNDRFLEAVRSEVSDANLLHWNGTRVPWLD
jgi:hypothetical protein